MCLPIWFLSFCWGYRLSSKSLRSFSTFTRRKIASWFLGPSLPFHTGRQANSFGWPLKPWLAFRIIRREDIAEDRGTETERERIKQRFMHLSESRHRHHQIPLHSSSMHAKEMEHSRDPILQLPISRQSRLVVLEPCPLWSALHTCELSLNVTQCRTQYNLRN